MKLILLKPLKELKLTNPFGAAGLCYSPSEKKFHLEPIKGCKEWGNDYVNFYKVYCGLLGHNGTDFAAKMGEPVYASLEGTVTEIETEIERGYGVGIVSEQKYEYEGGNYRFKLRYWHLLGWAVKMGQKVKAGDLIGVADNTGWSSASHLHWEGKPQTAEGNNAFQNNGYYGAIDLMPFLEEEPLLITKDLKYGMYDPEIIILKKGLVKMGYPLDGINFTDFYGSLTSKAVLAFQRKNKVCCLCIWGGRRFTKNSRDAFNLN